MSAGLFRRQIEAGTLERVFAVQWVAIRLDGEVTLARVQGLYQAGDSDTRWMILTAQRVLQINGLEDQLRTIVQNETDPGLRLVALRALVDMRDENSQTFLHNLMDGSDPDLASLARHGLEKLTGRAIPRRNL